MNRPPVSAVPGSGDVGGVKHLADKVGGDIWEAVVVVVEATLDDVEVTSEEDAPAAVLLLDTWQEGVTAADDWLWRRFTESLPPGLSQSLDSEDGEYCEFTIFWNNHLIRAYNDIDFNWIANY